MLAEAQESMWKCIVRLRTEMQSFQVGITGQVSLKGLRVTLPVVRGTAKPHNKGGEYKKM